jgi:hypothetical protein
LDDGSCGLPDDRTCALDLHLPYIVEAVKAIDSNRIQDYAKSIADTVCFQCPNQDEEGNCNFRINWECALDTLAYLVVEAIDEVDGSNKKPLPPPELRV